MECKTILYEKKEQIGIITLNNPESNNALSAKLKKELGQILTEVEADKDIVVVIITGNEKCFAAGGDITELNKVGSPLDANTLLIEGRDLFNRIEDLSKPVIAAVSGFALGGGCELAMACDLRIAAENASFGQPEIKIGVIPGAGGTQRLPKIIGITKAKELLYTGDAINANEAYRLGLVNKVVPIASMMDEAKKIALKIARLPASAVKMTKLAVNAGMSMDIKSGVTYEARCFEILFSTEDQKEGMKAFLEKRRPVFNKNL